jgi:hypothetical protein
MSFYEEGKIGLEKKMWAAQGHIAPVAELRIESRSLISLVL